MSKDKNTISAALRRFFDKTENGQMFTIKEIHERFERYDYNDLITALRWLDVKTYLSSRNNEFRRLEYWRTYDSPLDQARRWFFYQNRTVCTPREVFYPEVH